MKKDVIFKKRIGQIGGLIACKNYPLIYLNMPKSACTTIKNLLYFFDNGEYFGDPLSIHKSIGQGKPLFAYPEYDGHLQAILRRRISFTFVRHPLKRAYSCFNDKIYNVSAHSMPKLRNQILHKRYCINFPQVGNSYTAEEHTENFVKFLKFVSDNLQGKNNWRIDPHWMPQTQILEKFRSVIEVDFIGKLERYAMDITYIFERAGIPVPDDLTDIRFHSGGYPPFAFEEVMSNDVLKLAQEVYEADYIKLGYEAIGA